MKKNLARAKNPRALALNPDSGVAADILSCQRRSAVDQDKVSKDGHTLGRFLENRFMVMRTAVARCDIIRFRGIVCMPNVQQPLALMAGKRRLICTSLF